ncbi:hypothetical protein CEXT_260391 [Caerostris extrusa]|uniref:Uncharacterized protein n=1 Tax=Caerostris extrusa TaxID=172846 RepID=A0AAV4XY86_CAEEX|nr:hypothetical protein CEXT_260391 [Caerostris extrusa]
MDIRHEVASNGDALALPSGADEDSLPRSTGVSPVWWFTLYLWFAESQIGQSGTVSRRLLSNLLRAVADAKSRLTRETLARELLKYFTITCETIYVGKSTFKAFSIENP